MIFTYVAQKVGCCSTRKKIPSSMNRQQQNLIISDSPQILNPALVRYQLEKDYQYSGVTTPMRPSTPTRNPEQILQNLQSLSKEEQNAIRVPINSQRNSKRKTFPKSHIEQSELFLNLVQAQMNQIEDHLVDGTWKLLLKCQGSNRIMLYMNQPDEMRLNIQLFGYYVIQCPPQEFVQMLIDPIKQTQLDDQIDTYTRFECNKDASLQSNKFYVSYQPTLFSPESELVLETVLKEINGIYYEATKSIDDDRFPTHEDVHRFIITTKGHQVQTLHSKLQVNEHYRQCEESLTLVTFYSDMLQGEMESYDTLEDSLIKGIQTYVEKVSQLFTE